MSLLLLDTTPLVPINTSRDSFSQIQACLSQYLQQDTAPSEYLDIVHRLRHALESMQAQRMHTCQVIVVERKCASCLLLEEAQRILDTVGIILISLNDQNIPLKRSYEQSPMSLLNQLGSVIEDLVKNFYVPTSDPFSALLHLQKRLEDALVEARISHRGCIPITLAREKRNIPVLLAAGCLTICLASDKQSWQVSQLIGSEHSRLQVQMQIPSSFDCLCEIVLPRVMDYLLCCQERGYEEQPSSGLSCFLCSPEAQLREEMCFQEGSHPLEGAYLLIEPSLVNEPVKNAAVSKELFN